MKAPVEHSDNRKRGELAHVRAAIATLRSIGGLTCARHRRTATHLLGTNSPACDECASDQRGLTFEQRMRGRRPR